MWDVVWGGGDMGVVPWASPSGEGEGQWRAVTGPHLCGSLDERIHDLGRARERPVAAAAVGLGGKPVPTVPIQQQLLQLYCEDGTTLGRLGQQLVAQPLR